MDRVSGAPALRVVNAGNRSPMTLDGTRSYLVGRSRPVVLDPGPDDEAHLRALVEALGGARPAVILLTHAHDDHAAAAPALARRTGAPIWMGAGALRPPFDAGLVGRWLSDGDAVESDAGALRAIATPGHAPEHLAFWWNGGEAPPAGALFVGDLLMGEGDTTLVAPPEGDLDAYLVSLDRVAALAPGVLLPAHGEPLSDPADAVARYRRHREGRIEQVRRALEADPGATPEELVDRIYGGDLHPSLRPAAEGSLRAVLHHLSVRRAG